MAGYIMTLDNLESLKICINTGTYSTNLSSPKGIWSKQHEGTFADYFSMKENDNIYFFIKRKIYGIGKLVSIKEHCTYLNYIDADKPVLTGKYQYDNSKALLPYGTIGNRCFCIFEPCPLFFNNGIDMDDVLSSNPSKFRMLRALWKLSFIKIDDEENQALFDIILKRNEDNIISGNDSFAFTKSTHEFIGRNVTKKHILKSDVILESCKNKTIIKHEMAIEAALCDKLIRDNDTPFGKWDYISHQVVASPFKAIDYMDKMDVFGYRYIHGYKTRSKYLVIEVKKDIAKKEVVDQIMKYVDWIQAEYAYGDYSMIEAYIVASNFTKDIIEYRNLQCIRNFSKGYRPTISCKWDYVKLIRYSYEGAGLSFEVV